MTRRRNWREIARRVDQLEANEHAGETTYLLANGMRVRTRNGLDELYDCVVNKKPLTATGRLLISAVHASDGSRLHELYAALAAGPVRRNTPQEVTE